MTKRIFTLEEVRDKIKEEMDLVGEDFIEDATEFMDYVNEAIDEAEAEIQNLNEDYFLSPYSVPLVNGTASYVLPSDIYANKIRHIQYKKTNAQTYTVERVGIEKIKFIDETNSSQEFCYHLENTLALGQRIVFHPTPAATDSTSMKMWYIRNAARVDSDADTIDIPEFIEFIFAFIRVKIARKELSPLLSSYEESLERQRILMRETLDQMVPDADARIEADFSFYCEFDGGDI